MKAIVVTGAGGNFARAAMHEIIGLADHHDHARTAGVHAHDGRPGEGHARLPAARCWAPSTASAPVRAPMMALACDMRYGTEATKTAFLFTRVGWPVPTWDFALLPP